MRRVENDRSLTRGMIEQYREQLLERITDENRRTSARREIESAPVMDRLPAHGRILLDRLDHIWVRNYAVPSDTAPSRWSVFSSDGRWLTDVRTPRDWNILEIGADWILALATTDLDVEVLRLYRLNRRPE